MVLPRFAKQEFREYPFPNRSLGTRECLLYFCRCQFLNYHNKVKGNIMPRERSNAISSPSNGSSNPQTASHPWHSAFPVTAPSSHIVYSPFSAAEAHGQRLLGTSWQSKKKFQVRHHGDSASPLAKLHPATVIYVVCHSQAGSATGSDNFGNRLDAMTMARRIESDGLDYRHRIIKLWACSGGSNGPQGQTSFAKQLKSAFTILGYKDLTLYAYTATLKSLPQNYDPAFGAPSKKIGPHKTALALGKLVRAKHMRIVVT